MADATYQSIFKQSAEGVCAVLGRGLPFPLQLHPLTPEGRYHHVIFGYWDLNHGRPPYGETPFSFSIALVTEEGKKQGYKSGIEEIYVDDAFKGFGLAKILARNALILFKLHGDRWLEGNTKHMGARVWQEMGYLAQPHGVDLNNDDNIFENWSEDHVYLSHAEQCAELIRRMDRLVQDDYMTDAQRQRLSSKLDPEDPASIWHFIEDREVVTLPLRVSSTRAEDISVILSHFLMRDLQVHIGIDLHNNMQMSRIAERTAHLSVDQTQFDAVTQAHIVEIRRRYDEEKEYDEFMARVYAITDAATASPK